MRKITNKNISNCVGFFTPELPSKLVIDHTNGSFWEYEEHLSIKASCISCINLPCKKYNENELHLEEFKTMPSNGNLNVCPSEAIEISNNKPIINSSKCISCGICIQRCLYKAISISKDNLTEICHIESEKIQFKQINDSEEYYLQNDKIESIIKEDRSVYNLNNYISNIDKNIISFIKRNNNYENTIIRNILLNIGLKTNTRAIGNNSIRIDLWGKQNGYYLICEIDIGGLDLLDLTRAILDDIAILHSRLNIPKDKIIPIIIIDKFPNKRSDYYEVIKDIEDITGIKIMTITLHFLLVMQWLNLKFNLEENKDKFIVKKNNESITKDCLSIIPYLDKIDPAFYTEYYSAIK